LSGLLPRYFRGLWEKTDSCDIAAKCLVEPLNFSIPRTVPDTEKFSRVGSGWTVAKLWHLHHRIPDFEWKMGGLWNFALPSQEFLSRLPEFLG
tara:strand:- start:5642 stop:5920 length:279 start_codon:yes stop_codon:yes gene_type:complete